MPALPVVEREDGKHCSLRCPRCYRFIAFRAEAPTPCVEHEHDDDLDCVPVVESIMVGMRLHLRYGCRR